MFAGSEQFVEVGGKTYHLSKFESDHFVEVCEWGRRTRPDPFGTIKSLGDQFGLLSPDERKQLIADAKAEQERHDDLYANFSLAMDRSDGVIFALSLLFRRHHPGMTQADIVGVLAALGERAEAVLAKAFGTPMKPDETAETVEYLREKGLFPGYPEHNAPKG